MTSRSQWKHIWLEQSCWVPNSHSFLCHQKQHARSQSKHKQSPRITADHTCHAESPSSVTGKATYLFWNAAEPYHSGHSHGREASHQVWGAANRTKMKYKRAWVQEDMETLNNNCYGFYARNQKISHEPLGFRVFSFCFPYMFMYSGTWAWLDFSWCLLCFCSITSIIDCPPKYAPRWLQKCKIQINGWCAQFRGTTLEILEATFLDFGLYTSNLSTKLRWWKFDQNCPMHMMNFIAKQEHTFASLLIEPSILQHRQWEKKPRRIH